MHKGKILIIESDNATQQWLSSLLEKVGYSVEIANSGEEGILSATRESFEVIIIDLKLSDSPGEEIYDSIRKNPMVDNVPFIIFSEKSDIVEMERLREKGFSDYIVKRSDVEFELLKSVATAISDPRPEVAEIKTGKMITFFSAKGGNGTSTLCLNIAHSLANKVSPKSVLVVDLVLPIGTLGMMNGMLNTKTVVEITSEEGPCNPEELQDCIDFDETWNFSFIRGSGSPRESQKLNPDKLNLLFANVLQMYDYILIDMGKNLSKISLPLLKRSDFVVAVFGADHVTADLTQKTISFLEDEGIQKKKLFPVLNRAVGREGMTKSEIEEKFDIVIKRAIPYAANKLNHSNNQQKPYANSFPEDIVNLVFEDIANLMIEHNTEMLN